MMNVNPRQMQKMMQRMGINQTEVAATEVIIKTKDKEIVLSEPTVQKINAMGQVSYQISGKETIRTPAIEIKEEDIEVVMAQTKCSREKAIEAIKKADFDLAEAILSLK